MTLIKLIPSSSVELIVQTASRKLCLHCVLQTNKQKASVLGSQNRKTSGVWTWGKSTVAGHFKKLEPALIVCSSHLCNN